MTERETECLVLAHELGARIDRRDWTGARLVWGRLIDTFAPVADWQPHLDTVLRHKEALAWLAERSASKLVH